MARLSKGILDGVSGKVGNVIGGSWKGIDYVRSKPVQVHNPKTVAQQRQRSKFKGVTGFARSIVDDVIHPIWDKCSSKMSGYNRFVQANIGGFGDDGSIQDFSALKLSDGSLPLPLNMKISNCEDYPGSVLIEWDDYSEPDSVRSKDFVNIIHVAENGEVTYWDKFGGLRGHGDTVMTIKLHGKQNVYVFFSSEDGTLFSPSQHACIELS